MTQPPSPKLPTKLLAQVPPGTRVLLQSGETVQVLVLPYEDNAEGTVPVSLSSSGQVAQLPGMTEVRVCPEEASPTQGPEEPLLDNNVSLGQMPPGAQVNLGSGRCYEVLPRGPGLPEGAVAVYSQARHRVYWFHQDTQVFGVRPPAVRAPAALGTLGLDALFFLPPGTPFPEGALAQVIRVREDESLVAQCLQPGELGVSTHTVLSPEVVVTPGPSPLPEARKAPPAQGTFARLGELPVGTFCKLGSGRTFEVLQAGKDNPFGTVPVHNDVEGKVHWLPEDTEVLVVRTPGPEDPWLEAPKAHEPVPVHTLPPGTWFFLPPGVGSYLEAKARVHYALENGGVLVEPWTAQAAHQAKSLLPVLILPGDTLVTTVEPPWVLTLHKVLHTQGLVAVLAEVTRWAQDQGTFAQGESAS